MRLRMILFVIVCFDVYSIDIGLLSRVYRGCGGGDMMACTANSVPFT
jgi:hypothetical protein